MPGAASTEKVNQDLDYITEVGQGAAPADIDQAANISVDLLKSRGDQMDYLPST